MASIREVENRRKLERAIKYLNEVTGLNLELEEKLSWKDGKTMLYEVVKHSPGIVESYSDLLPAKQLLKQINILYIFARQLRDERLLGVTS